jgi:hypothetical protein
MLVGEAARGRKRASGLTCTSGTSVFVTKYSKTPDLVGFAYGSGSTPVKRRIRQALSIEDVKNHQQAILSY